MTAHTKTLAPLLTVVPTHPSPLQYFLNTQPYYDDNSVLAVTIVGVDKPYKGARSILEYYTLQVAGFNPDSHRHFGVRFENNTDEFVPVSGNQMQLLNMNPQVNNGEVQSDSDALWSDFAHFIWDNSSTVAPVRRAFVDFRYPNVFPIDVPWNPSPQRVGANLPLLNSFGNVWDLCQRLHERCFNKNRQFESVRECMAYMKKLPDHKLGYFPHTHSAFRQPHAKSTTRLPPPAYCSHPLFGTAGTARSLRGTPRRAVSCTQF
jgi:hypothetical protein